ncbi:MAG: AAA family ATPase [Planctomycetota bacterium]
MRKIALINQKGGVGKTTTAVNLGAALAETGSRVVLVDLDPQANLTLHLGIEQAGGVPTTYDVLLGEEPFAAAIRPTATPGLRVVATDIQLSGAELELASALGRETLLRDAVETWRREARQATGEEPADYLVFDCPPSLGLLSINALAAADEVFIAVQTEFFALQGMSKLVEVVGLVRRRLHPALRIRTIVPCLYDSRLRLAREVLAELRAHFPQEVSRTAIGLNVKLAEAPSFGKTILEYAPDCHGARDYRALAMEIRGQEAPAAASPAPPAEIRPAPPPVPAPVPVPVRAAATVPAEVEEPARREGGR